MTSVRRTYNHAELCRAAAIESYPLNLHEAFALINGAGAIVYVRYPTKLYGIESMAHPNATGKQVKNLLNASGEWLFLNTDCLVIRGVIRTAHRRAWIMSGHCHGTFLKHDTGAERTYHTTLASWAQARGLADVLQMLKAAGQTTKHARLLAAAEKAGLR
jgi:hypothetical protein